jgi:hypothetical protein
LAAAACRLAIKAASKRAISSLEGDLQPLLLPEQLQVYFLRIANIERLRTGNGLSKSIRPNRNLCDSHYRRAWRNHIDDRGSGNHTPGCRERSYRKICPGFYASQPQFDKGQLHKPAGSPHAGDHIKEWSKQRDDFACQDRIVWNINFRQYKLLRRATCCYIKQLTTVIASVWLTQFSQPGESILPTSKEIASVAKNAPS